jgi:two-component system, LytTR family, sensor kinase
MSNQLPAKSLVKLNWIVSLMCSVVIFTFLLSTTGDMGEAMRCFFQALIFFSLTSFANLFLLNAAASRKKDGAKLLTRKFYALSFTVAIAIGIFTRVFYGAVAGTQSSSEVQQEYWQHAPVILAVITLNSLIIIIQNLIIVQQKRVTSEFENLQLIARASETENLLLRQQIHPHFLFNSLTTIKSLYNIDPKQGERYLVHLANFLRVAISNQTATTALIKDELEFCLDYLKMQETRFGAALTHSISIEQETIDSKYLPYFCLQPLVENVLKHNDLTESRPIKISIQQDGQNLRISNNMQPRRYKEPSTGFGLSNLTERYRLLGSDDIAITSDDRNFTVTIKILDK